MAFDFKAVDAYLDRANSVEKTLEAHHELFDIDKLYEFREISSSLEKNKNAALQDSRKLCIGIVGAVKAGKSSFLNACLFSGQDLLPKAATPMTAALTKITYSETPKALIHFYTKDDWAKIEEQSQNYDKALTEAYDKYIQKYRERMQSMSYEYSYMPVAVLPEQSKDEFEKSSFRSTASEIQRGSKELTDMLSDPELLDRLGETDIIEGDVYTKLNQYVGATGKFTPIVSYVELQINNEAIKEMEIVDTPGLNDPIVSRGVVTKQFLRSCDVVLLLSPCSQFMNANTVTLMANSLSNANVENIIVIGSKLDSGILNEKKKCPDFKTAYKKSVSSYKKQFSNTMEQVQRNNSGRNGLLLQKIAESDPMFVSSICYSIHQKQVKGVALTSEEEVISTGLKGFNGFENNYFRSLSGVKKIQDKLNEILSKKQEIIAGRNGSLLSSAKMNHLRILENIIQDVVSSRQILATTSLDELNEKKELISSVIDSSRSKLFDSFEGAAINCNAKVAELRPQITLAKSNLSSITITTTSHSEHDTVRTGFLGLRRETICYTVTEREADVSEAVRNLQEYAAICQRSVLAEYQNIFNREQFCLTIKRIMLTAFIKSGRNFDEDEILQPLNNVLNRISIPELRFDVTPYIDRIDSEFPGGVAKGQAIHKLNLLQETLLAQIDLEIGSQLEAGLQTIRETLNTEAVTFADKIDSIFRNDLDRLSEQVNERERYINEYKAFRIELDSIKAELSKE